MTRAAALLGGFFIGCWSVLIAACGLRLPAFGAGPASTERACDDDRCGYGLPGGWDDRDGNADYHLASVCDVERGGGCGKFDEYDARNRRRAKRGFGAECGSDSGEYVLHRRLPDWGGRGEDGVLGGADDFSGERWRWCGRRRASGVAGQPVSVQYVNSELATVVHLAGTETITGAKTFTASPDVPTPVNPGDIANKGYVDASVTDLGSGIFLPTAGGTMSGPITLPGNALQMSDAVAQREIVNADQFRDGVSRIIDGVVECMNASAWAKAAPQAPAANTP